jgi:tetratricopeptide (TPR) repeat protein
VGNLLWVAAMEEGRGNLRSALGTYKRAYERAPEDEGMLENMARLAAQAGLNGEALEHYEDLARRHPNDSRWKRAAEGQREALLRGPVRF